MGSRVLLLITPLVAAAACMVSPAPAPVQAQEPGRAPAQRQEPARGPGQGQEADRRPGIAVLPFENGGVIGPDKEDFEPLTVGIQQMLLTELAQNPAVRIVERRILRDLIAEQDLGASGRVDPQTAARIGRLVGARYVVKGVFMDVMGTFRLDGHIVDVETSEIIKTEEVRDRREKLYDLLVELAHRIMVGVNLPELPAPVREARREREIPPEALALYSRAQVYEDAGRTDRAIELYRRITQEFPQMTEAREALQQLTGGFALGAGASYLVAREFEPLEVDAFAYRPGNTLSLQVAADRNIGRAGKATLQVAMEHHEEDALNGANLYRAGRRYRVIGSYAFAAGARSSGIVYAGAQHRDRGRSAVDLLLDVPAQDLVVLGGGMRVPLGRITLTPNLDARLLRSDDGTAQGHITTAGAAVEVPLSRSIVAVPSLRARVGNLVVREGQESAMRGLDFALTLRSPVALRSPLTSR